MSETEPKLGAIRVEQRVIQRADDAPLEVTSQRTLVWTGEDWVDVIELVRFWNEG